MKLALGVDFFWWLTPTRPELTVNYYERTWPKREVKRMYKMNSFGMEEEDTDVEEVRVIYLDEVVEEES